MNHLTVKQDAEVNRHKSGILKTSVNPFRRETNMNASFHLTAPREMSQHDAAAEAFTSIAVRL